MGRRLRVDVNEIDPQTMAFAVWAQAKASKFNKDLLDTVADSICSRSSEFAAKDISMLAWGFAKVRARYCQAFHHLALVGIQHADEFDDQMVSNVLWAFARLQLNEEDLFTTLMQRADRTLYNMTYRYHEKKSETTKSIQWCQVYVAYKFCCKSFPATVASLPRRLVADLQKIDRREMMAALSEGSGVESVQSLRELDAMVAEMEDAQWMTETATEPDPSDGVFNAAASGNATVADMLLRGGAVSNETIGVHILKFSRSPKAFKEALLEGEFLEPCRQDLIDAEFDVKLDSGAKIFVRPEHFELVRDVWNVNTLRCSHHMSL